MLLNVFGELSIADKDVVFVTRDDGSDVKKACSDSAISSCQCAPHALNNIVQAAFNGDAEKEALPKLKKKAQTLGSSFCKKAERRQKLTAAQKVESETFFSDATSLYGNKQRNRLSAESAQKLLQIKVMLKRNIINVQVIKEKKEESEESDSGEEYE